MTESPFRWKQNSATCERKVAKDVKNGMAFPLFLIYGSDKDNLSTGRIGSNNAGAVSVAVDDSALGNSHFEYSDDALIFALYYLLNQSKAFELSLKLLAIERTLNYLPSRLNECSIKVDAIEALDAISGGEGIPARALTLTELGPSTPTVLIDRRKSPPLLRLFSYIRLLFLVPIRKESSRVQGFLDWYYWLVHLLGFGSASAGQNKIPGRGFLSCGFRYCNGKQREGFPLSGIGFPE
ncbi:hypothetical protein RDI58_000007 [Solanum bulbocastanum]|uniref:Uncharacterized protein n=1 Tax=Solanum bulbocastanum TaxID=147425 RepID=A0AAN8XVT6_SOLBU